MIAIRRVFVYEFRRNFRRGGYLFMSIGIPLIAIALFFGVQAVQNLSNRGSGGSSSAMANLANNPDIQQMAKAAGIVDQTPEHIISADALDGHYQLLPSVEAANAALQTSQLSSYLLLPPDYVASGKAELWLPRFSVLFNLASQSDMGLMLRTAMAAHLSGLDPAVARRLIEKAPDISNHRLDSSNRTTQTVGFGTSYLLIYLFALALVFSTFLTSGYLMQAVMEERQNRVVEVLIASLRPGELLAGKVFALGLLGLLQMTIWGAVAYFLIKQAVPLAPSLIGLDISVTQVVVLIAYFVFGYLMYAAVYAGIGTIANSQREGPQFAVFFTLPAMLPLYLSTVFALQPDGTLPVLMSLFPVTAPLAMVMRVAVSPVPAWQIGLSLFLLLLTGLGFMWVAGRLFRVTVLLSGQTPPLRDIPKLLRQSGS